MNNRTFHLEPARYEESCDECGAESTISLVADSCDSDGYVSDLNLCDECYKKLVNKVHDYE